MNPLLNLKHDIVQVTGDIMGHGGCPGNAAAVAKFFRDILFIQHMKNQALEIISPRMSRLLIDLYDKLLTSSPSFSSFGIGNACHLNSMAILFNKNSGQHLDRGPHGFFDSILVAGKFASGGELHLVDLGLKLPFLPGSFCALRGRLLRHGTLPWKGKGRSSLVDYVHDSVVQQMGIANLLNI